MKRIRVALVASSYSTFVQRDREILREAFFLREVLWKGKRSIPKLVWSVLRSDVTFSWFALDHAYGACWLARILRRKSVVVVGGVDAAKRPDMSYGVHLDPVMGRRSRYALAFSNRVLVVDDFLREEISQNTGIRRPEIVTVPLGFDVARFSPDGGRRTTVLTVGIVDDVNLRRKGLETFVRSAAYLPDLPFVLVGARPNAATRRLSSLAGPNVRILGGISDGELLEQFRIARVYVQASEYEGLPTALGEAMACGCVPVGTRVAGIPTLIGDSGLYVPVGDPKATADAIRTAYSTMDGDAARRQIQERFSLQRRRDALLEIVRGLVGRSS